MQGKYFLTTLTALFFCIFLISSNVPYAQAQDISVEMELNRQKIVLDSFFKLTMTIHGTQKVEPIELPEITGFKSRYLGPTRNTSIVNGQKTVSIAFNYALFPLKTGSFQIPAFQLTIDGTAYTTQVISVEVIDTIRPTPTTSASTSGSYGKGQGEKSIALEDKVFLRLKTSKDEIYLNERLPVKIMMFVTDLSVRDIQFPSLEKLGLKVEKFARPKQYSQVVRGARYDIVEFDTVIYPTRTGKVALGPVTVEANIVLRSSSRGGRAGSSFFNDSFFNSFFDSYEKHPISIASNEVVLKVLDLPKEGRPQDFSGAVGNFQFEASIGPKEVQLGDPITLRMRISGEGNLSAIKFPKIKDESSLKFYDPMITSDGQTKTLEQVLIPTSDQIHEIPTFEFAYFDTKFKKYRKIVKGPFPIVVTKSDDQDEGLKVVGINQVMRLAQPEILGEDIVFIKSNPGTLRPVGYAFYKGALFYMIAILGAGGLAALYLNYYRGHRMATDVRYARRLHAPRQAKKDLAQARQLMTQEKTREYYDCLFKTLQHYLGNKFHLSAGSVTIEAVTSKMGSMKKQSETLDEIRLSFEECDSVRYASSTFARDDMNKSYQRVAKIIDWLERVIR